MIRYTIEFKPSAAKAMRKLDRGIQTRIIKAIDALALDPRPAGMTQLSEQKQVFYRIREGDYRVIYQVIDTKLVVLVVRVGHRSDVYKGAL